MSEKISRSTWEAYSGIAVAIVAAVLPMTWTLKLILVGLIAIIVVDIAFRHPKTINLAVPKRLALAVVGLIVVAGIFYKPIRKQYLEDSLPRDFAQKVEKTTPPLAEPKVSEPHYPTAQEIAREVAKRQKNPPPVVIQSYGNLKQRTLALVVAINRNLAEGSHPRDLEREYVEVKEIRAEFERHDIVSGNLDKNIEYQDRDNETPGQGFYWFPGIVEALKRMANDLPD